MHVLEHFYQHEKDNGGGKQDKKKESSMVSKKVTNGLLSFFWLDGGENGLIRKLKKRN